MNDISEEKETPKLFDFQLKSSRFGIDVRIPCISFQIITHAKAVCGMTGIQTYCSVRFIAV